VLVGAAYQVPPLPFTMGTIGAPMFPTPPVTVLSRPGVTIGAPVVVVVDTASALPAPDVGVFPPAGARLVPPMFRTLSGTADIALLFGVVVVTAGLGPVMSTGPGRPPVVARASAAPPPAAVVAVLPAAAPVVASLPVVLAASEAGAGGAVAAGAGGVSGRAGLAAIRSEFGAAARGVCKPGSDGFTVADVVLVVLVQSLR